MSETGCIGMPRLLDLLFSLVVVVVVEEELEELFIFSDLPS
jgi:hypothetical protein